MRALSCNPPYGTLIAACERFPSLGKHIETRGRWAYTYRGLLLIHQTTGLGDMFDSEEELWGFCEQEPFRTTLAAMGYRDGSELPRGEIVARVALVGVVRTETVTRRGSCMWIGPDGRYYSYYAGNEPEYSFGDYRPGRTALLLANIRAVDPPIRAQGQQGLWIPDAETVAAVEKQLSVRESLCQKSS